MVLRVLIYGPFKAKFKYRIKKHIYMRERECLKNGVNCLCIISSFESGRNVRKSPEIEKKERLKVTTEEYDCEQGRDQLLPWPCTLGNRGGGLGCLASSGGHLHSLLLILDRPILVSSISKSIFAHTHFLILCKTLWNFKPSLYCFLPLKRVFVNQHAF